MVKGKTVFIVGAGASNEVNLPFGYEFKQILAKSLDIRFKDGYRRISGDNAIYEAIRLHIDKSKLSERETNEYLHAAWRIHDALPLALSIDNLLDTHRDDERMQLCGKLAICRAILNAEEHSGLALKEGYPDGPIDHINTEHTWLNKAVKLIMEACRLDELEQRLNSICFVVFNYDRCIEHFLYHALKTYYAVSKEHAASLVNLVEIIHPYGVAGKLPWQGGQGIVPFGGTGYPARLLELSDQIKVFTEGATGREHDIQVIHRRILEAETVVFLGFAYHKLNMTLISPPREAKDRVKRSTGIHFFGTAKGISAGDCKLVEDDIKELGDVRSDVHIRNDLACTELFDAYWRRFSLGL